MKTQNINIQHALNGGEFKLGKYSIDGYCEETNTCYEFYGIFFHGCPDVYASDFMNTKVGKTMGEIYERTIEKENYIKSLGYNLIIKWEHDWNDEWKIIKLYLPRNILKFAKNFYDLCDEHKQILLKEANVTNMFALGQFLYGHRNIFNNLSKIDYDKYIKKYNFKKQRRDEQDKIRYFNAIKEKIQEVKSENKIKDEIKFKKAQCIIFNKIINIQLELLKNTEDIINTDQVFIEKIDKH